MAGLPLTALFGASAAIATGDLTIDLAELHAIAIANNAHHIKNTNNVTIAKLVPDTFVLAHWDTAENILALIQAVAYAYAVNNPKETSARKYNCEVYQPLEGTSSFEEGTFLLYNQLAVTNYWSSSVGSNYDPSQDAP